MSIFRREAGILVFRDCFRVKNWWVNKAFLPNEKDATPKVQPKLCQMTQAQLHAERERLMQNVPTEATVLEKHKKRLQVVATNLRIRFKDLSVYKT